MLRSINKYKALRTCLKSTNEHGILDSLWNSFPYDRVKIYTKLVKDCIHEYWNWVAWKIGSLAYDVSI